MNCNTVEHNDQHETLYSVATESYLAHNDEF